MMVRAKFFVSEIRHRHSGAKGVGHSSDVVLRPVIGDENKPWSTATPAGSIEMTITTDAIEQFEPGKSYFVDFTPAD